MIVGVQGSESFRDYSIFLSAMYRMLIRLKSKEGDKENKQLMLLSAGPKPIENMAKEYLNVSEFKSRGIKTRLMNVPESWFKSHLSEIDIFYYFCNKKENLSSLGHYLNDKDIEVQTFRYSDVQLNKKDNIYNRGL
jgi:hypothetical protein